MNADDFVRAIERSVRDVAVKSTITNLKNPPGQKPDPHLVRASEWFNHLNEDDRRQVEWIVRWAANHATHGFLTVIDGARAIFPPSPRGHLELYSVTEGHRELLNDITKTEPLNDKFTL